MKKNYEIKDIADYFMDLKMVNGKYAIRVSLPEKWKVPKYEGVLIGVQKNTTVNNGKKTYIICNDEEHDYGQSDLIGVMIKIKSFNEEMEEKRVLLKEKVDELVGLFEKNGIEELRKLTFSVGRKRGRPSKTEDAEEKVEEGNK